MPFLYSALAVLAWQAVPIALYHFGEVDTFWFAALETLSVITSLIVLVVGWAAAIDWSK
jgi:hypothetical protein